MDISRVLAREALLSLVPQNPQRKARCADVCLESRSWEAGTGAPQGLLTS